MMQVQRLQRKPQRNQTSRLAHLMIVLSIGILLFGAMRADGQASPEEPQGEIIGTIEGQGIAVKGPMSVQVVGNEVKTLLRSGVDVRVKVGRARISLVEGGTIAICGPAHISMLKAKNALTIALDSGTIHAHVDGNLALSIFTAQILAKTVAIGDGPQDALVGFDTPGLLCARAGRGALRLEEQFGNHSVMVPQGGDVTITNGQLQGLRDNSGLCACEAFESSTTAMNIAGGEPGEATEISKLATHQNFQQSVVPRRPSPQGGAAPKAPDFPKPAPKEPIYQVFMPPLRYDASAKVQDEPDPQLIVLVRRVRVRPTLIFQSRVEGDPVPSGPNAINVAKSQPQIATPKSAAPATTSVLDRVKSFIKNLWTPSS
jgi:hypothetical protein